MKYSQFWSRLPSRTGADAQPAESRIGAGEEWSAVLAGAEEITEGRFLFLRRLESEKQEEITSYIQYFYLLIHENSFNASFLAR